MVEYEAPGIGPSTKTTIENYANELFWNLQCTQHLQHPGEYLMKKEAGNVQCIIVFHMGATIPQPHSRQHPAAHCHQRMK